MGENCCRRAARLTSTNLETSEPPLGREVWAWNRSRAPGRWKQVTGWQYGLPLGVWCGLCRQFSLLSPLHGSAQWAGKRGNYWQNVDLYRRYPEHATGHPDLQRFWNKFL